MSRRIIQRICTRTCSLSVRPVFIRYPPLHGARSPLRGCATPPLLVPFPSGNVTGGETARRTPTARRFRQPSPDTNNAGFPAQEQANGCKYLRLRVKKGGGILPPKHSLRGRDKLEDSGKE